MSKYSIDVKVLDNATGLICFTLSNHSDQDLCNWLLTLDFMRFIIPESLSAGSVEQIGTFTKMQPDAGVVIAAHSDYSIQFNIKSAAFLNFECGIRDAFLTLADQRIEVVTINQVQLLLTEHDAVAAIPAKIAELGVIPQPLQLHKNAQQFLLSSAMQVHVADPIATHAAAWLSTQLSYAVALEVSENKAANITFTAVASLAKSEYILTVNSLNVEVKAATAEGFTHAVASLLQLVKKSDTGFYIQGVEILDKAQYDYRGLMLDCSRHFHSVATVKRLINQMAHYKLNHFHWHLTDDEGWRIEIKAFPELTEIGAWRGPGAELVAQFSHLTEKYGGFYTQQEIKEVIDFAQARGITIVPEIDVPGHCRAAIRSLPHLLVDPQDQSEYLSIQAYTDNVLSPALVGTYTFLDTVMEEVCALFPGPFVHVGADEVPTGVWKKSPQCQALMVQCGYQNETELQGHLLRHVEKKLNSLGKRMLGWEEVKSGDKVSNETVIYSWTSEEAGLECVKKGFDVVMQPCHFTYFDLTQSTDPSDFGADWAGALPLQVAYQYQPLSSLAENDPLRSKILGVQCALWCELVLDQDRIDYMFFPRLLANAEVSWSHPSQRDWSDFCSRLNAQIPAFKRQGINYRVFNAE